MRLTEKWHPQKRSTKPSLTKHKNDLKMRLTKKFYTNETHKNYPQMTHKKYLQKMRLKKMRLKKVVIQKHDTQK